MSQTCLGRAGKRPELPRGVGPGHAVAVERHQGGIDAEGEQAFGGVEPFLRCSDPHADGQARLDPVRSDAGAAGVAMIVGVADGIGDDRHARRPGQLRQPRNQVALADALVVVAHQDEVDFVHAAGHAGEQFFDGLRGDGAVRLAIHPHHLVRMPLLRPAQEPLLHRRAAVRKRQHLAVVHLQLVEQVADDPGFAVLADHGGQYRLRRGPRSSPRRCRRRPAGAPVCRLAAREWGPRD